MLALVTPKTASDVNAELEARYRDDPAYRAAVDAREASVRARAEQRQRNLAPFTQALEQAGVSETSDRGTGRRHADPRIFEIAFKHLDRSGYDDETRATIARSFETRGAAPHWDRLEALYLAADGPQEREALAAALSTCAKAANVGQMKRICPNAGAGKQPDTFPPAH